MDQRVKGQEIQLFMTQNGQTLAQLDSIQDTEVTIKLRILEEGYVGETSQRYDDVFDGFAANLTAHMTTGAVYDIVQAIIDRARRRVPGTVFNLKMSVQFPNGERKRVMISNLFFGEIPNAVPKRDQYASIKFTVAATSGRFL